MQTEYIDPEGIKSGMILLATVHGRKIQNVAKIVRDVNVIGDDYSNGIMVTYEDGTTEKYPAESVAIQVGDDHDANR